jgi:hypothetical protein
MNNLLELHDKAGETLYDIRLKSTTIIMLKKLARSLKATGLPLADDHDEQIATLKDDIEKLKKHYRTQGVGIARQLKALDTYV